MARKNGTGHDTEMAQGSETAQLKIIEGRGRQEDYNLVGYSCEVMDARNVVGMLATTTLDQLQRIDYTASEETAQAVDTLYGVASALRMLEAHLGGLFNALDEAPTEG